MERLARDIHVDSAKISGHDECINLPVTRQAEHSFLLYQ